MSYSDRMQKNHIYSVYFAPRGATRMADLGMQIAQQYLSPFDKLIGLVGEAGSGKSMLIKGMFPGLELTNDDSGVNVRPLPLLDIEEADDGFYSPHTYHLDIRFESAFTQMHELADCIETAVSKGRRVIVEHFDLIYPFLNKNAHLLLGIGEEVIITRPSLFGPEPQDIADIVLKSLPFRRMTHSAEDLCQYFIKQMDPHVRYTHSDVRHGFILSFESKPNIDIPRLQQQIDEAVSDNIPICFVDDEHIKIGDDLWYCSGPRMHVHQSGEIKKVVLNEEILIEPITNRYLLVGIVGEHGNWNIKDLNKIE